MQQQLFLLSIHDSYALDSREEDSRQLLKSCLVPGELEMKKKILRFVLISAGVLILSVALLVVLEALMLRPGTSFGAGIFYPRVVFDLKQKNLPLLVCKRDC